MRENCCGVVGRSIHRFQSRFILATVSSVCGVIFSASSSQTATHRPQALQV